MSINKISFITPVESISSEKIVLEKNYSRSYQLENDSTISLASNMGNTDSQQDCIAVSQNGEYLLLLVTDGIGGMESGEAASYNTAKIIKQWLDTEHKNGLINLNKKKLEDVLTGLMYIISTNIPTNSGATLNMSIITPTITLIANIGDSRTYTLKNGKMTLRTIDDSLAFQKFRPTTGEERDKLRFYKGKHVITNSIAKDVLPSIKVSAINNEDYDIICHMTDGVSDILSEHTIELFCQTETPATNLVTHAVESASLYRYTYSPQFNKFVYPGQDNATAVVYTKKRSKNKIKNN